MKKMHADTYADDEPMVFMTKLTTATKMVKLQYACDAHWTRNWPSSSFHAPVEKSAQCPLKASWCIDMGTHTTTEKTALHSDVKSCM